MKARILAVLIVFSLTGCKNLKSVFGKKGKETKKETKKAKDTKKDKKTKEIAQPLSAEGEPEKMSYRKLMKAYLKTSFGNNKVQTIRIKSKAHFKNDKSSNKLGIDFRIQKGQKICRVPLGTPERVWCERYHLCSGP